MKDELVELSKKMILLWKIRGHGCDLKYVMKSENVTEDEEDEETETEDTDQNKGYKLVKISLINIYLF